MIEHGEIVRDMLLERGITDVEFLHGSVNTKKRHQLKNSFKHGEYRVLIGSSIFNVGINLPIVSGIVNFAAGNAQNTEIQKIGRALRKYSGEKGNYVDPERGMKVSKIIEVLDKNIAFFEAQAWNRYRTCKSEFGKERVRIIGQVDSENSKRRAKKTVEASSVQEQIDLALEWFKNLDIKE
jgi:superfamily II DNA or RNA helicase